MTEAVVTIKVVFDKEEVKLQLQPGEFQFMEFDCWLRNRFDISPTDKVSFKNKEGIECLPTKHYFSANNTLLVEKRSGKATSNAEVAPPKKLDKSSLIRNHIPMAVAVIAMIVYFLAHADVVSLLGHVEERVMEAGYYLRKEVMLEAVINGLGWSIMHLFIRRMLNPENSGKWFDGYFLDSCYGGVAACGQTLFKGFFLYTLLNKHK
eukprot:gene24547-27758_t